MIHFCHPFLRLDCLYYFHTKLVLYCRGSETLDGLSTIHAFGSESKFSERNNNLLDTNQIAFFTNFSANCWLAVRLEFAGALIVATTALLAVIARQYRGDAAVEGGASASGEHSVAMFAGMFGLAISLSLSVTQVLSLMLISYESYLLLLYRLI